MTQAKDNLRSFVEQQETQASPDRVNYFGGLAESAGVEWGRSGACPNRRPGHRAHECCTQLGAARGGHLVHRL